MKLNFFISSLVFVLIGCGSKSSPEPILPDYVKRIQIPKNVTPAVTATGLATVTVTPWEPTVQPTSK